MGSLHGRTSVVRATVTPCTVTLRMGAELLARWSTDCGSCWWSTNWQHMRQRWGVQPAGQGTTVWQEMRRLEQGSSWDAASSGSRGSTSRRLARSRHEKVSRQRPPESHTCLRDVVRRVEPLHAVVDLAHVHGQPRGFERLLQAVFKQVAQPLWRRVVLRHVRLLERLPALPMGCGLEGPGLC